MVPFSFKSEQSYSRVMKRYLTDMYWMMGSMDFWINGSRCRSSSVMLDPTSMMLDPIVGKRESHEDCEVWNSQLLSPKFWLLASARFKPVLKGFKPIYTIQGTLFLSHAERQGCEGGLAFPRLRRQKCSTRGAANDSRGGCAPQNKDGGTAREDSRPTKEASPNSKLPASAF